MMSAYELAHQLAQAVRESSEFQQFIAAKKKVKADQFNHKILREFQMRQLEIQQSQLLDQEIDQAKQQELERMYSLISLNPSAREYLEAEFRMSCLINDIQMIIGEAMEEALPIGLEEWGLSQHAMS